MKVPQNSALSRGHEEAARQSEAPLQIRQPWHSRRGSDGYV